MNSYWVLTEQVDCSTEFDTLFEEREVEKQFQSKHDAVAWLSRAVVRDFWFTYYASEIVEAFDDGHQYWEIGTQESCEEWL